MTLTVLFSLQKLMVAMYIGYLSCITLLYIIFVIRNKPTVTYLVLLTSQYLSYIEYSISCSMNPLIFFYIIS